MPEDVEYSDLVSSHMGLEVQIVAQGSIQEELEVSSAWIFGIVMEL